MAIDPVCEMKVKEESTEYTSEYNGKTYYFCASGCKKAFDENPEKYLNDESESHNEHHHGHHHH